MCQYDLEQGHIPKSDNIGAIVELIIGIIRGHFDFLGAGIGENYGMKFLPLDVFFDLFFIPKWEYSGNI
jgi:hypothetical protein